MNKLVLARVLPMVVVVAQPALADYDTVGSAVIGGVAGAVIGHAVGGRNGAAVGAAIGGVSGAVISANSRGYSSGGYYEQSEYRPAPVYTRTQVVYAQPAPVYYQPAPVYYQPVRYERVVYPAYGYGFRHGWHHGWDRDRDYDRGDREFRGYGHY